MHTDEHPDVFQRLTTLGHHLDDERDAHRATGPTVAVAPRRRHSRVPLIAASLVTVAGLGAVAYLNRSGPPHAQTPVISLASAPTAASEPPITPAPSTIAAAMPIDMIAWQRGDDVGSLARSQVSGVTAGPVGFVATGMGFDDGRNQGRVWYSSDGLTWEEPAFDLFDAKSVSMPAATADAFFVLAQSNPDRLGLTEGTPGPADAQLYRSTDGHTWEPWGDPWVSGGSVASTGQVLLRSTGAPGLEWSSDGLIWTQAVFPDGTAEGSSFDVSAGGVTAAGGRTYLRGFRDNQFVVWSSTNGTEWHELPPPPAGGSITAVDGGLVVITNPREAECARLTAAALDDSQRQGGGNPNAHDEALQNQWNCGAQPAIYRYDTATGTWTPAGSIPAGTPIVPALDRLGNTLVAPLVATDRSMTVWIAAADGFDWQAQADTQTTLDDNAGSPGIAAVASNNDTTVIITNDRLDHGETAVIVGHL